MRGQMAHELSWLAIALLLIMRVEVGSFKRDSVIYSVFNVVFEVVSRYGSVESPRLPDQAYNFSGGWHIVSKLILYADMLRGRHRGLPVAIDRAVLPPGDHLASKEEEDHEIRKG
jgi:Trk-type K+ transport system membrane component